MNVLRLLNPARVVRRRALVGEYARNYTGDCARALTRSAWQLRSAAARAGLGLTYSERRLAALRDRHRGARCFLVANGPSLRIEDLNRLRSEIAFGSNRVFVAFGQTEWRPAYYSVMDDAVIDEAFRAMAARYTGTLFLSDVLRPQCAAVNAIWLRPIPYAFRTPGLYPDFSTDVLTGVEFGATVLLMQLQLAFHMGFQTAIVIGLDFSYDVSKAVGPAEAGARLRHPGGSTNHFHPDYWKPGQTITRPNMDVQRDGFRRAREVYERHGRRVINASRQTRLDVLERGDLDALLDRRNEGT